MVGQRLSESSPTRDRVRRRNLWIWYWATDTEVQVVDLTDEPPVPFG
jgi:hypothetical protein